MLIRPTSLTLVEIFFWILPMAARLVRVISIKTKEIILNLIAIMKEVYISIPLELQQKLNPKLTKKPPNIFL